MKIGKVPPEVLERLVWGRRGAFRKEVVVGPALGEDAAVIDLGGRYLAVHADPISGSVKLLGYLAAYVPTNDVAVRGSSPCGCPWRSSYPPRLTRGF
jgi:hydrogenase expression/formation protein HypE